MLYRNVTLRVVNLMSFALVRVLNGVVFYARRDDVIRVANRRLLLDRREDRVVVLRPRRQVLISCVPGIVVANRSETRDRCLNVREDYFLIVVEDLLRVMYLRFY